MATQPFTLELFKTGIMNLTFFFVVLFWFFFFFVLQKLTEADVGVFWQLLIS